jgi:hypothetical protein
MYYCRKCGEQLKGGSKFCNKCGVEVGLAPNGYTFDGEASSVGTEVYATNSRIKNELDDSNKEKRPRKVRSKLKIILIIMFLMVLIFSISAFTFIKLKSSSKENNPSISIVNVDIAKYPNIVLTIKADNYKNALKEGNFTVKEKDVFQKGLKLEKEGDNKYVISYKSSGEFTSGERSVRVAYLENDKESIAEINYDAPEKDKNDAKIVNSNNTVNTYDRNEIDVKASMDKFEDEFIRTVNSKDINYIKDTLDLSGGMLIEFTNMLKSYSEQKITESLLKYDIENIKKISDVQYEVTTYEKFSIHYGNKNETKQIDFRNIYILNKTNSGFKVYSLKNQGTYGK